MKNLFTFIAIFVGLALLSALGGVVIYLYVSHLAATVLYAISGANVLIVITLVIMGFVKSKKLKSKNDK